MKNITVIGAGTMGNGIAHVCAFNGYRLSLVDISDESLQKGIAAITKNLDRQLKKDLIDEAGKQATLGRISCFTDLGKATAEADLVIEAATENPKIKAQIFADLLRLTGENTILATNTSSISITSIAGNNDRAGKIIGMHFMNPVPVMQLVEVIRGYSTSDETTAKIMDLSRKLGKIPVEVNDYPGFISNRILLPMINEAIFALFEGIAGVDEIDTVMRLGMAHPMGPLRLADFIGLDVCASILRVLHDGYGNPKYAACPLLVNMVNSGNLGVKSGSGFYDYAKGIKNATVSPQFTKGASETEA